MKHFTLIVCKPNSILKDLIVSFYGAKDPYGIDQWIVFDQKIKEEKAFEIFDSLVTCTEPGDLNAVLFANKNQSRIVKQVGEIS